MRAHTFAIAIAGAICACNHTPISGLEESFSMRVDVSNRDADPVAIDFLWVIDNSSSMCQEQASLGRSFDTFVSSLQTSFDFDARIAVTSVAAQSPGPSGRGRFNRVVNEAVSVGCIKGVQRECGGSQLPENVCDSGLDCEVLGLCDSDRTWTCERRQNLEECIQNPNGSFNEACKRRCISDEDCQTAFNDPTLTCLNPGATINSGCIYRAPIESCPDVLPQFLERNSSVDNASLFPCIASVGLSGTEPGFRYEEPLRSVSLALALPPEVDDTGERPNRQQAADFLRDDAYLVIVIVSDEEDCSVEPGREAALAGSGSSGHRYDTCGLLPTSDAGGPLTPVGHFVNRFKAVKDDPSKVIVAVIAGDSLADAEADKIVDRQAFYDSKGAPRDCHGSSYICESDNGVAEYGNRLRELAEAFGPNGTFENICGDEGIGPALVRVADSIIAVVNRLCLPKPILGQLRVTRTSQDGTVTELVEGQGPGTYAITLTAEDCAVDGQPLPAISLWDRPQPDDVIDVTYQGDPQLP